LGNVDDSNRRRHPTLFMGATERAIIDFIDLDAPPLRDAQYGDRPSDAVDEEGAKHTNRRLNQCQPD
jgi:hypothetical protein